MPQDVQRFYGNQPLTEWNRLETPYSRLEFLSTIRLIEKYFPRSGKVIDIGGEPGRYAIELLRRGYEVTLLDLVEEHLQIAKQQLDLLRLAANDIVQGDAQDLSRFTDNSFDAGLMMGPLYSRLDKM
jgi:ubiquinone/menaquinone biosynthesis C-methylase UbiE